MALAACRKCNQPIAFRLLASGRYQPTNPDGSDHWDSCNAEKNKTYTGALMSEPIRIIGKYFVETNDTSCPFTPD